MDVGPVRVVVFGKQFGLYLFAHINPKSRTFPRIRLEMVIQFTPFENAKKAGQSTFKILLLNDANMIGEH